MHEINTCVIPNDVENYEPGDFTIIPKGEIKIIANPEEVDRLHLFRRLTEFHVRNSGIYNLSPFSFNWNQHGRIYTILSEFKKISRDVTLSTCRIDAIARDPGLVKLIEHFGSKKLTIAVEGISERIRQFLQKGLTTAELYAGVEHCIASEFQGLKFYFIYTGMETEEDLKEFNQFLSKMDDWRKQYGKPNLDVRISFTPLLATLGTPLQYMGAEMGRKLKAGDRILYKIPHMISNYGYFFRMSSTVSATEFAQIWEYSDRRFQYLLEYLSLNGCNTYPQAMFYFYDGEEEVTEAEFRKIRVYFRMEKDGKFYKARSIEKISLNKMFTFINMKNIFDEINVEELLCKFRALEGKEVPEELIAGFPPSRRKRLAGKKIHVQESKAPEFLCKYRGRGKDTPKEYSQHSMLMNIHVSPIQLELTKRWLPLFTNGVSFSDMTGEKSPIHIFPHMHIKTHKNAHLGQDFRRYWYSKKELFDSYCLGGKVGGLQKCLQCGACDTKKDVKHVSGDREVETSDTHYHLIEEAYKDNETATKLLLEVRIDRGPYSALKPEWLRAAINRAILMASNELKGKYGFDLVKALLFRKYTHSRQNYKLRQKTFKSMLAGSFIYEISFNGSVPITEGYVKDLFSLMGKYTTKGWRFVNIRQVDPEYSLMLASQWAIFNYRFDDRKVDNMTLDRLNKVIDRVFNQESVIKYRAQEVITRHLVKAIQRDFDKSKIIAMASSLGANEHETVLKLVGRSEGVHPLILLAGLLGTDSKAKVYTTYYGTDITIEGYYHTPPILGAGNIFDHGGEETAQHSTMCPQCGEHRLINVMTGLPFGKSDTSPWERVAEGLSEHESVCQNCWINLTS